MDGSPLTATTTPANDFVVDQGWNAYSAQEHALWRHLFERQSEILPGRACDAFLDGLRRLGVAADGIPDFERLSDILEGATGWRIVAVSGLVPDDVFFWHLANRRFPVTNWIRTPQQMDYLQEPDVFHDLFGHVPMLTNPVLTTVSKSAGNSMPMSMAPLDAAARNAASLSKLR